MIYKSYNKILLTSVALILSACGGGSSTGSNQTPTIDIQPTRVDDLNWQSARLIQTENPMENSVEVIGSKLNINVISDDISKGAHLQIYINSDNKPETGFQFDNQAWEESGVDFLIEDGDLFKSTANNSGWNWNVNIGDIDYSKNGNSVTANLDLSLLGEVCNNIKVGVMTRDESWNISTFSPASAQMQTFTVSYCNTEIADTVKPEITLLGANPLNLLIGGELVDPGATALDDLDGIITNKIVAESTVNTSLAGTYSINYSVSDLAGNTTELSRVVIVNKDSSNEGIVVDGNINDWSSIPTLTSSADAIMKVSDDEDKLYILVTSSNLGDNIQVLMDTDNNDATGLNLSSQISTWLAGADHMIENNSLDQSKSNTSWSWDYGIAPIEYIKTTNALEIAIKKSDLNSLANQIPMGFVSRTINWNVSYVLPGQALPIYTLEFPLTAPNIKPIAQNDSDTTPEEIAITLDVLSNDTSNSGSDTLTISSVSAPSSGIVTIVDARIIYSPDSGFFGTDSFTYTISDSNGETATATVTITVTASPNNPPVANNDSTTTVGINTAQIAVLSNDTDADSDTLQITGFTSPSNGSITLSTAAATFNYTPNATFSGIDTFTYTISDGNGGIDSATVSVTVPVNNSPDAVEDATDVDFDKTKTINVLSNDTDPDGDTLSVLSIVQPPVGVATLNNNGTIFFDPQNNVGSISIGYTVSDGRGGTDFAVLTVSSTNPNDGNEAFPIIIDENITTSAGTAVFIDVLANDSDPDGDTLILDQLSGFDNGTVLKINGGVRYTPNPGFIGTDFVYYGVHDGFGHNGFGTITITITP